MKHPIIFANEDDSDSTKDHLFCYTKWKQHHPNRNSFGVSAILSSTLDEVDSPCCYLSIHQCANSLITIDFGLLSEFVFVAIPLGIKFCFNSTII